MILSNTSIQQALDEGRLVIDPEPAPRVATPEGSSPYGRSSVDLRLGPRLRVPKTDLAISLDPASGSVQNTLDTLYETQDVPTDGFVLRPQQLVLGLTLESVKFPLPHEIRESVRSNGWLAARVEGKSSLARFGLLVHFTAPTIHAGFELVHGVPDGTDSQFAGQTDAAGTP